MSETSSNPRQYLDPRVLAKVGALELRARLVVEGLLTGQHRSPYQGASVEFAQHRPYVQGDDIRHVDWKVLARNDKVYLKQYQVETNLELMLLVDASESMGFGTVAEKAGGGAWSKYDHATAIAGAMAFLAIGQQDSVGLGIFDQGLSRYFRPSNNPAQWRTIVNELQGVPRWNKTGTGKVLEALAGKLTHRSIVVVISDLFDDEQAIIKGLRLLRHRKHEVIVFQVLDPTEIEFPFEEVTLFKGLEEAGDLLTEPKALRAGYLEQLRLFTETLKKACRGMNIEFQRLSTGDGLDVALTQFLAGRMGRMK